MEGYKPARDRTVSAFGIEFISTFEGFLPDAYLDELASPPVWTIGFGDTIGVKEGDHITRADAEKRLHRHVIPFADSVRKAFADVNVTQHMFDAVVSLTYNEGPGLVLDPAQSTFARRLLAHDYKGAADAMLMWDEAGGVHLKGLKNRRLKERALFLKSPHPKAGGK